MIFALATSLLILTVLVLVMFILTKGSRLKQWIVYLVVPFLLFNIGFSWHTVHEMLGQATISLPKGKFDVMSVSKLGENLYIVVKQQDKDEPTFHTIPNTEKNKKQFEKAQKMLKKNIPVKGEFTLEQSEAQLNLYQWDHQKAMPKVAPNP